MKKVNRFLQTVWCRMCGIVAAMLFPVVATCSFSACADDDDETPSFVSPYADSRTVMVYMVAENSLSANVWSDVNEMLVGMKNDSLKVGDRLVIYVDDLRLPRIYVVDKMTEGTTFSDLKPVVTYDGEVNSATAEGLSAFMDYAVSHYPAESYGLLLWSHASGWLPSSYGGDYDTGAPVRRKSFGLDNGMNSSNKYLPGNQMSVADMVKALEGKPMLEFILFDACLMQNIEVAYELRHTAKYMISSPAEIPLLGANYTTMSKAMFRKDRPHEHILEAYYREYAEGPHRASYGIVVSSVNMGMLDDYVAYMKTVVAAHKAEMLKLDVSDMLNYICYGKWTFNYPDFLDMQGIMLQVLNDEEYAQWKAKTDKVIDCLHTDQWYTSYTKGRVSVDDAQCCGVSMFIPFEKYSSRTFESTFKSFNEAYSQTSWAKDVWMD